MKKLIIPVAFAFALGTAHADNHGMPTFEELDADTDGMLSSEELSGHENIDFDTVDADGDGKVSAAEYEVLTEQ